MRTGRDFFWESSMFCPCHVHHVLGSRCVEEDCSLESGRLETLFHVIWTVLLLWELAWPMRLFHAQDAKLQTEFKRKKDENGNCVNGHSQWQHTTRMETAPDSLSPDLLPPTSRPVSSQLAEPPHSSISCCPGLARAVQHCPELSLANHRPTS